jgi:hypothetical protein
MAVALLAAQIVLAAVFATAGLRPSHCGACFRGCRAPCSCRSPGMCVGGTFDDCPDNPPVKRAIARLARGVRRNA